MQLCKICLEEKPLSDFYAMKTMKSGHMSKCKECFKKEMHEARKRNIEHYREYDRKRGSRMTNDDLRRQRASHPEWTRAHNAVNKAVRSGKLIKSPAKFAGLLLFMRTTLITPNRLRLFGSAQHITE